MGIGIKLLIMYVSLVIGNIIYYALGGKIETFSASIFFQGVAILYVYASIKFNIITSNDLAQGELR